MPQLAGCGKPSHIAQNTKDTILLLLAENCKNFASPSRTFTRSADNQLHLSRIEGSTSTRNEMQTRTCSTGFDISSVW